MKRLEFDFVENTFFEQYYFKGLDDNSLKVNLWFASMALIQCPYDCKVDIDRSLAYWKIFIKFINKKGQKVIYMIDNLENPERVYNKICDAIGI